MIKKNVFIIISLFVFLMLCFLCFDNFFKPVKKFGLMSSKGDLVPINMYNRGNNEFVLVFDKEIDMGIYQVLIIIPSQKIIGLPEGGKNSYIELSNKFLYQKRKAKQFTLIGTAYFEKNEIFNVEFENQNEIRFESSLPSLKNYGKNFVLKWEK